MRVLVVAFLYLLTQVGCVRHVVRPSDPGQHWDEDAPAGMVDVSIVSARKRRTWNVYADGQQICTTPCAQRLNARQPLVMQSRAGEVVEIPELGPQAEQARRAVVVAEPTRQGMLVNGIVFTTLGGMGVVVATTLTAVGCSNREQRGGMCTAGLITGAATVPLTAVAIWMIVDSSPRAHVLPVFKTRAGSGEVPVSVALTPTGVAGTF